MTRLFCASSRSPLAKATLTLTILTGECWRPTGGRGRPIRTPLEESRGEGGGGALQIHSLPSSLKLKSGYQASPRHLFPFAWSRYLCERESCSMILSISFFQSLRNPKKTLGDPGLRHVHARAKELRRVTASGGFQFTSIEFKYTGSTSNLMGDVFSPGYTQHDSVAA